ncbi:MAG: ferritin [Chloroflexota bacterium]
MIINSKVVDAMNAQIQSEFGASAQYVAIAVYFDDSSLPELANFFFRQAEEEREHAMKFVHFLLEAGAKPLIRALPDMVNEFNSPAEAVQFALDQEIKVTNQINNIMAIAVEQNDFASQTFLQWFVTEQVEEVDSMDSLLQTINYSGGALLLVEDYVRRKMAAEGEAEEEGEE